MGPQTLFVADLHLDNNRPHIIAAFCRFLQGISRADAFYILGDLFEYWIGDDGPAVGLEPVLNSLRDLSISGTPVYLVHGNRDFLIGQAFARRTRCKILPEESVIDLYGTSTLIMHGDTLCTDDIAYQKYKARIRNKWLQRVWLLLSVKQRIKIVKRLRDKSIAATQGKQLKIMDVNQNTVKQAMLGYDVQRLIHGHTHRPGIHDFTINGNEYKRIVLGDWYAQGSVLKCTPDGMKLESVKP